jgi:protein-S-isoprenylcysteine O-methyltransferase Ste14
MNAVRSAPLSPALASASAEASADRRIGIGGPGWPRLARRQVPGVTLEVFNDLLGRAVIAVLFTLLSVNLFADFLRTGHVTGLLLVASESLVVVLTITRRRAQTVDRSAAAAVVTTISLATPALVRASQGAPLMPDVMTAMISAAALCLVLVGKIALGRSFGLVPANRGVVVRGPYTFVRHPIYTGYLVTHVAFLVANPTPWNVAVFVIGDTALIVRALMEERVLSADVEYQRYCVRVGWHLVPGVF